MNNERFGITILLIIMIIVFVLTDKGLVIASATAVGISNYWFGSRKTKTDP